MESNSKILELVGNLVGRFLAENGGYSNGYYTYVKGIITPNKVGGIIDLMTPALLDKSSDYIKSLKMELEVQIKKLLSVYPFDKELILDATCTEYGVYFLKIHTVDSRGYSIPDLVAEKKAEEEDRNRKKQQDEDDARRRRQDDETALLAASTMSAVIACM
jgi:hypothetical protein